MDIRPLLIAAVLLVALIVAVVAMPVNFARQLISPQRRRPDDDDAS
jgi:hypothetical protein